MSSSSDSARLDRVDNKLDRLQEQLHENHLEILGQIRSMSEDTMDEINALKLKVQQHDGHFSLFAKLLGGSSIIAGWLSVKDLFHK